MRTQTLPSIYSGNNPDWNRYLQRSLDSYEEEFCEKDEPKAFNLYLVDSANFPVGGLLGYYYRKAFFINTLWIAKGHRKLGLGKRLMRQAAKMARKDQCSHLIVQTNSFNAPSFYEKLGFTLAGTVPNFPKGNDYHYFYKTLNQ